MKAEYLLKVLVLWMVILLPVRAGAEDLGALRLSQMEGDVQVQSKGLTEWFPAAINLPVQAGDRFWVPEDAWAQVETREGSVIRLAAGSSLEILAVEENSLQVYLSQGQAYLNVRGGNDSMLQVDTPVSSIKIYDPSILNVALVENGQTEISVFRGAVYAENRSGEIRVGAGKMLSMDDDLPMLMSLGPPSDWEKWNKEWDESLADGEESEQYLPQELAGYGRDLNRNGRWVETSEYGYVWTPTTHISADWAPYRQGRWVWIGDDYVWIASEPWGWAPYHYGRWSHIPSHGWCWVPPPRNEVYWGPGYVSWIETANDVAWVPLAPAEVYYGHGHYGPHSVNIVNANIYAEIPGRNYRNVHVRDAVTVVRRDSFLRGRYQHVEHRENPFLREPIHIGRPRLEPERATRMPIIRDIPREHQPPVQLRSMPGRTGDGERPLVRERGRSVFTPTVTPRPLSPAVRMSPDPAVQQTEDQRRQQVLEHPVMPGQFRGRTTINRESVQDSIQSAPVKTESGVPIVPPVPVRGQAVPGDDRKAAPGFRGRSPNPEYNVMPGQFRGRPAIDREAVRPAPPPAPARPQIAPPPAPAPQPPAQHEERNAPGFRGRSQAPEYNVMPGQFRGRPAIDREAVRPVPPPAPVRPQNILPPAPARGPQIAPPPAPGPGQPAQLNAEELKRLQKQQAADKEKAKEAEGDKILKMPEQRGGMMRPRSH